MSGLLENVAFSPNAYKQKYLTHVKRLKDFNERTKELNIVPWIRKHMLKLARYVTLPTWFWLNMNVCLFDLLYRKHAKVDDPGVKSKPTKLSQEDIEAAKKEWENIVLSDGENDI